MKTPLSFRDILKLILVGLAFSLQAQVYSSSPLTIADSQERVLSHLHVKEMKDKRFYELELIELESKQIIIFNGGFGTPDYKPAKWFLKGLKEGKDIHFYIKRGFGGSVSEHKKFIKSVMNKCKSWGRRSCKVITYLDGQCSSMCTTLFVSGDVRYARDDQFANLGFHRTFFSLGDLDIPISSPSRMVQYFKKFDINGEYLEKHKERIFRVPENGFYRMSGEEIILSGFGHELHPLLDGTVEGFLAEFHGIVIE